jgi:hypothetical protein
MKRQWKTAMKVQKAKAVQKAKEIQKAKEAKKVHAIYSWFCIKIVGPFTYYCDSEAVFMDDVVFLAVVP